MCGFLTVAASHCRAQALTPGASVVVMHRLSCPASGGIFPDQELNPSNPWQTDSWPLDHQGSPEPDVFGLHRKGNPPERFDAMHPNMSSQVRQPLASMKNFAPGTTRDD